MFKPKIKKIQTEWKNSKFAYKRITIKKGLFHTYSQTTITPILNNK
jgi:hypothetical protein